MSDSHVTFMNDSHYYEGAKVSFYKMGLKIAGLLFKPENFDTHQKYPALVITHPGGGVKEQCSSLYGWNLAKHGYITLAFDASYQDESEGTPRYLEDPASRVEDIRAAIDYLVSLPYVDEERIGAMGICAGGGYTLAAAQTESRIRAVAGVCARNVGAWIRDGIPPKGKYALMQEALKTAADCRTREARGEPVTYVGYVPNSPEDFTEETSVIMKEASEYYRTKRCGYPTSVNKMALQSLDRLAAFDAFQYLDTLSPRLLLFIVGSKADTIYFSEDAMARAREPKELYYIEGATHIDLFDKPEFVPKLVAKLSSFFDEYLR